MEVGIRGVGGGGHQRCKVEAICSIHVIDFMYLFIYLFNSTTLCRYLFVAYVKGHTLHHLFCYN